MKKRSLVVMILYRDKYIYYLKGLSALGTRFFPLPQNAEAAAVDGPLLQLHLMLLLLLSGKKNRGKTIFTDG